MNTRLIRTGAGPHRAPSARRGDPAALQPHQPRAGDEGASATIRPHLPDGQKVEEWGTIKPYRQRFEHPLWTRLRKVANKSGHGGMDYVMSWR